MRTHLNYELVLTKKRDRRIFERLCSDLISEDARALILDRWDLIEMSLPEDAISYGFRTADVDVIAAIQDTKNWRSTDTLWVECERVHKLEDGSVSFDMTYYFKHDGQKQLTRYI